MLTCSKFDSPEGHTPIVPYFGQHQVLAIQFRELFRLRWAVLLVHCLYALCKGAKTHM